MNKISGQYVVHLPDCRTQIVDYFVDEYKQVRFLVLNKQKKNQAHSTPIR